MSHLTLIGREEFDFAMFLCAPCIDAMVSYAITCLAQQVSEKHVGFSVAASDGKSNPESAGQKRFLVA